MDTYYTDYLETPIGWLEIKTDNSALFEINFKEQKGISTKNNPSILLESVNQLTDFFNGKRKIFNVKINPVGSDFQKKTWKFVSMVPFGKTSTYLKIAKLTGSGKNTRAVGTANGKNPIPIIIPCHRIIGSNNKLTGYAGGIERKRWLLQHELQYSEKTETLF